MVEQVGALRGHGILLFDPSTLRFAEPYSGPLLAALADAGIPFVTYDEGFVHQVGEGRRAPRCGPGECGVRERMTIVTGDGAYATPAGSTRAPRRPGRNQKPFPRATPSPTRSGGIGRSCRFAARRRPMFIVRIRCVRPSMPSCCRGWNRSA